jgi:glutathione synthase/RimK-type ligase-like ATP-grasp enzyme
VSITLGIHPDRVRQVDGQTHSFSDRWRELAQARGVDVRMLNVRSHTFLTDIVSCDAFMWRVGFSVPEFQLAKRVIAAIEHATDIQVFPSSRTFWHFEDKIAQHYLLSLAGIPTAATKVFWTRDEALRYCAEASYPFVVKLAHGMKSRNVVLARTRQQAESLVNLMFGSGVSSLEPTTSVASRLAGRRALPLKLLLGQPLPPSLQNGYFLVQEFLPGNDHDTRVTIIGDRAFAFRRFNRPNDFRASGSGRIDWDPTQIDPEILRLGFTVARTLGAQSIALDVLRKEGRPVVLEISYTYAAWAIRDCPGHWVCRGGGADSELAWVPGSTRAEDAIFEDFSAGW